MFRAARQFTRRFPLRQCSTSAPDSVISSQAPGVHEISLSKSIPGFPKISYATVNEQIQNETRVTTLPNGLRIASQPKFGQFCTIGVIVDAGSRYEVSYPSGISHFLEKLSFQSTKKFSGRDAIQQQIESHGGIFDCQIMREAAVYASSVEVRSADGVVDILGEVSQRMRMTESEIESARQAIRFELEDYNYRNEQDVLLTELIHAAAYRANTVGLPRLCPAENIDKIDQKTLFSYLSQYYQPSRMVIAGVGLDHDALVKSVEKYFMQNKSTWEEDSSLILPSAAKQPADASIAQYTGGDIRFAKDLSKLHQIPELVHFFLGFESCSHKDEDFIPYCVLNILMGGGGSFSAGGPGKGMYTRLYLNVLNQYHWLYNATSYNHSYADTGLFCIHASSPPKHGRELVQTIVDEFKKMTGPFEQEELNRAKTQLSSMLLMNLESRPVIFEDIGRQVLAYGRRKTAKTLIEEIAKVSAEDLQRVAARMLRTKPAVACLGNFEHIPSYSEIETMLTQEGINVAKKRRFRIFS